MVSHNKDELVGRSPVRAFVYAIASLIVLEAIALALHLVIVRHINIPSGRQTIQSRLSRGSFGSRFLNDLFMYATSVAKVLLDG